MSAPTKPFLSIIMGVYNAEKTLKEAIDSVIKQDFQDWEFIIADDGSTDKSFEILASYKNDPRFIILKNEKNLGLAETLNVCIKSARGEYLARQDADDLSHPERFTKQLAYLKTNSSIDVLGSAAYLINDDKQVWGKIAYPLAPTISDWVKRSKIIHPTVLMRTKLIKECGGYDPKALRVEDYELWLRLLHKKAVFRNINEPLYFFHWSPKDYKRKKYQYRLNEFVMLWKGFRLNRFPLKYYPYILKPLLLGLLPHCLLKKIHDRMYKTRVF